MSEYPTTRATASRHRPLRRLALLPLALATIVLGACDRASARDSQVAAAGWKPNSSGSVLDLPMDQVQQAIRTRVEADDRPADVSERRWKRVRALYQAYGDAPLWIEEHGFSDRARALTAAVREAPRDGLRLSAYPLAELRTKLAAVAEADHPTAGQLADAELLLSATYVALAEDLLVGQIDPHSVAQSWHIDPQQVDVDSAVSRALRAPRFDQALAGLRPADSSYDVLRRELAHYRQLDAAGGWGKVPDGATIRPGERAPVERLRALAARLQREGYQVDSTAVADSAGARRAVYGDGLAGAVGEYQAHHSIAVDSVLGPETVESLNLSARYRAGQIAANMERLRWLPQDLGSRYVFVNVPAFHLDAYENGKPALSMKVIVGAEYNDRATPAFSDSMSKVVFRPYWNVPEDLAKKEIYPKAEADPGYMERERLEVVTDHGYTYVRQKPGGDNSLGLVKFLFPNDFAIYLHDTPAKSLFDQDVRAASHGCIRIEKPAQFAQWVLGWDAARVQQAMHDGPDDNTVMLDRKLPVYIVYFTAYGEDGSLRFGNDLYDRDSELVAKLTERGGADAQATQTAEAVAALVKREG